MGDKRIALQTGRSQVQNLLNRRDLTPKEREYVQRAENAMEMAEFADFLTSARDEISENS